MFQKRCINASFYRIQNIPEFHERNKRGVSDNELIKPIEVSSWLYSLIAGGYATYYEIKYKLTVWDVLDICEIMVVKESNMNIICDKADERSKKN